MNELSTKLDYREQASELWSHVIDTDYKPEYQQKVDKNADKMIEGFISDGQVFLADLFYDVIEEDNNNVYTACEFEVRHSPDYAEELQKCSTTDEFLDLIDTVVQNYYESQGYQWYNNNFPFMELCIDRMAQYIMYRCWANNNSIEINSLLAEERLTRADYSDTEIYMSNSCNILFKEMINYGNIFCQEVCREFEELGVHLLLRHNSRNELLKIAG